MSRRAPAPTSEQLALLPGLSPARGAARAGPLLPGEAEGAPDDTDPGYERWLSEASRLYAMAEARRFALAYIELPASPAPMSLCLLSHRRFLADDAALIVRAGAGDLSAGLDLLLFWDFAPRGCLAAGCEGAPGRFLPPEALLLFGARGAGEAPGGDLPADARSLLAALAARYPEARRLSLAAGAPPPGWEAFTLAGDARP
jgi:hypothetical protein